MLERYYNKLTEGERGIRERQNHIQQQIQRAIKDVEREYQRRLRGIEKDFNRTCHEVKTQLLEVEKEEEFQLEKTSHPFSVCRTA